MAWSGWLSYAGNEIMNCSRTEAYAAWAELPWFKPIFDNTSLAPMLGDGDAYVSPLQDEAPWTDPDDTDSYGFYGVYPLDTVGIEDSSRMTVVTESTGDGGRAGRVRHGTKTIVFSAALIAEDEAAANYGFMWLKQALLSGPCGSNAVDCSGDDLCYLSSEPMIELTPDDIILPVDTTIGLIDGGTSGGSGGTILDGGDPTGGVSTGTYDGGDPFLSPPSIPLNPNIAAEDCLVPLLRSLRQVVFTSGPTITAKMDTSDGGAVWTVSFTAVAGEPWEYGAEVPVIEGFLDPEVLTPWAGGVIPAGGYIDLDGFFYNDKKCAVPIYDPLQDPLCMAVIPPPLPPSISLGCYSPPPNWRRRQITIPQQFIPLWGEVVPRFQIHARHADVRNLRLRFYADVDGDGDISDDPCAFCGDLVVSYVPRGSTLVFDTSERQVYAVDASQNRRRADSVVFSTDGTPFEWPVLSCGFGYIVTLDLPQTAPTPVFDLSLYSRVA